MKKHSIFLIILLIPSYLFSQCSFTTLFPVSLLSSRYQAIAIYQQNKKVKELEMEGNMSFEKDHWTKISKTDSVWVTHLDIDLLSDECINGHSISHVIGFTNDSMTSDWISSFYDLDNYNTCNSDYNTIITFLKIKYPYYYEANLISEEKNEHGGEAIYFFDTNKKMLDAKKTGLHGYSMVKANLSVFIELIKTTKPTYLLNVKLNAQTR